MKPQDIKEFLKALRKTDIEELRYKSGEDTLYFKKGDVPALQSDPPVEQSPVVAADIKEPEPIPPKTTVIAIKSTVVGIFSCTGADKAPLVSKGMKVKAGQKVGRIEAMKIVKDVISNIKGEVVDILAMDGEPVEFGQDLILIDTGK